MLTLAARPASVVFTAAYRGSAPSELIHLEFPADTTDLELARRIGRGDRWAEEAFYRRHVVQVVGLAQRLLGNSWDAEDVAQETFIAAFESWGQLRDLERARSWLMQIAVRKVHRKFRRRRLRRLLGLDRSVDDLPLEALVKDDTSLDVRAELLALDAALKSLPAPNKIAWMLRYVDGLPLDEVAERCDCSLATVKRRIAAAQQVISRQVDVAEPSHE